MAQDPLPDDPHRLPELRETSVFGRRLRRYLLPLTLLILGLLIVAAIYTVRTLDLDLEIPSSPAASRPNLG